jgi:hypothetical protein
MNDADRSIMAVDQEKTIDNELISELRSDILSHIETLKLPSLTDNHNGSVTKESIRVSHSFQRTENLKRVYKAFSEKKRKRLLTHFANGSDVNPEAIDPELVMVESRQESGDLFRYASLLWSVPVSPGYGRRMRYLVRDRSNGKLIGIFALGDPVFNLRARDEWIGWDVNHRRANLVHLMDAYVLGSVPPYSYLLGGKLVASLIGSSEISQNFISKYNHSKGIISGEKKSPRLVLVTVTSALGRSSLYNRMKLRDNSTHGDGENILVELIRIGATQGFGHFQLSDELFERVRDLLVQEAHPYSSGHQYGQGPNWRLRVMRAGLKRLGLDKNLTRHGIQRDIYAMPLSPIFRDFLCSRTTDPELHRPSASSITSAALKRWVVPRAKRRPEYKQFRRKQILNLTGEENLNNSPRQLSF